MSIRFDSETRIFVLETAHTSYHMKVDALGHSNPAKIPGLCEDAPGT